MDEILLIDKPAGWTSFDMVAKIRGKIRAEYAAKGEKPTKKQLRVGHAGTLDPFATGLLIILRGEACKQAGEFLKLDKSYEFTAKLGEVSSTGDPEGEISPFVKSNKQKVKSDATVAISGLSGDPVNQSEHSEMGSLAEPDIHPPTQDEVLQAVKQFTGLITQTPPAHSAIKINGKRAYKLAREGKAVVIPQRTITIYSLELIEYRYPYLKCRCRVSSGTYIRSLVEDLGESLGTGAYCLGLRRTQINDWQIADAVELEELLKRSLLDQPEPEKNQS